MAKNPTKTKRASAVAAKQTKPASKPAKQTSRNEEKKVTYSVSPGLPGFLGNAPITIAFSSYQSGKFYLVSNNPNGGIMIHERFFKKAMGIHVVNRDTLLLATLFQIHRFENTLARGELINST